MYGFLIEGIATLLCRISTKFLSDKEPAYSNIIDSFIATALVVAGTTVVVVVVLLVVGIVADCT
jgi:hypothetical protein